MTGFDPSELDRYLAGVEIEMPGDGPMSDDVGAMDNGFTYQERYGVIIECEDEDHQQRVFDDLTAQGHKCRVVAV